MPDSKKIVWDATGEKLWEIGLDHGVCYPQGANGAYGVGVAWNGLTAVSESPEGAEANKQYADNIEYANIRSKEEFKGTIEAFTYPKEFEPCDGIAVINGVRVTGQPRKSFGFSYRTLIGNDTEGEAHGYQIHVVYGCSVAPSEKSRETENDSPEPIGLSWEFDTLPVNVTTVDPTTGKPLKPVAHLILDTRYIDATKMAAIEDLLYGTENADPSLPSPDEIFALAQAA
jgi:hypothetical protein